MYDFHVVIVVHVVLLSLIVNVVLMVVDCSSVVSFV